LLKSAYDFRLEVSEEIYCVRGTVAVIINHEGQAVHRRIDWMIAGQAVNFWAMSH